MNKSFTERLTPGQVQQVLTALGILWRGYKSNSDGWTLIPGDEFGKHTGYWTHSDVGINVLHGGFVDHYTSGSVSGDLVHLVQLIEYEHIHNERAADAINWIQGVCGIDKGVRPPELTEGSLMAAEWLKRENGNRFTRMPNDILKSDLTPSEKLVWVAIFGRCGAGEIYSFPGIRRICEDTHLAMGTVQKSIKALVDVGLIIEKPRGSNANKAPARFPVVSDTQSINRKIRVLKNEHPCSDNELPCSKNRTKLDTVTIPKQLNTDSGGANSAECCTHSIFLGFISSSAYQPMVSGWGKRCESFLYSGLSAYSEMARRDKERAKEWFLHKCQT